MISERSYERRHRPQHREDRFLKTDPKWTERTEKTERVDEVRMDEDRLDEVRMNY